MASNLPEEKSLLPKRGRPRKPPTPSLTVEEIIELRKILEDAVKYVPEEIARNRSLDFREVANDLRPWLLKFLDCGYKPADFIKILEKSGMETNLTGEVVKHLFLTALSEQTGGGMK